jgi:hypothetical protein
MSSELHQITDDALRRGTTQSGHLMVYVKFGGSLFDSFPSLLYDDRAGIVDMSRIGSHIT